MEVFIFCLCFLIVKFIWEWLFFDPNHDDDDDE